MVRPKARQHVGVIGPKVQFHFIDFNTVASERLGRRSNNVANERVHGEAAKSLDCKRRGNLVACFPPRASSRRRRREASVDRRCGPAMTEVIRAASATVRVRGPICTSGWLHKKASGRVTDGIRPKDGLNPTAPLNDAGIRTEPPPSVPWPRAAMPSATAAALPPDEPPELYPIFHGVLVDQDVSCPQFLCDRIPGCWSCRV